MHAAQPVEQRGIEGLDAHRDTIDPRGPEQARFVRRERRRIAFDGPFLRAEESQPRHRGTDLFPMAKGTQRGRAPAKENSARTQVTRHQL